jgi:NitT/TauT family transport system substrate-binding protein
LAGPNAEEVVAILAEYTPLKDVSILRSMTPTGCDIDGRVNQKSLQNDLAFYSSQGLINGDANLAQLIDMSYVEEALRGIVK